MIRKAILPLLGIAGLIGSAYIVRNGSHQPSAAQPVAQPAEAPFAGYVAGAGIVEAKSENIAVGTVVPGIVTGVFVKYGDNVKAGAPLFQIEGRDLLAHLTSKWAALASAQAKLKRLKSMPRPEDIPPARAALKLAQALLDDAQAQYNLYLKADQRGVIQDELTKRKYAVGEAAARVEQAKANLDELLAGSWAQDIEVAKAEVAAAQAEVDADQILIQRLIVRAPIDGRLLQVKIHAGEYAPVGALEQPLILMGSVDKLVVRVDVDENDAWRVRPGARAIAYLKGNREIATDLTFYRIEPYVIPKKSLTGNSAERVDTRVLQVLYTFDQGQKPIYAGQQMDVFIEAEVAGKKPTSQPTSKPAARPTTNSLEN